MLLEFVLPDPMVPNSHLSSAAQHDPPRAPSVTMPLCEPSLFLGSPRPQLTFALHRTSLAEGRVGSLSLLQGTFQTQELKQGLLHCRQILHQLPYQGNPMPYSKTGNKDKALILNELISRF